MQRDNEDGKTGFSEGDVAAFGLASNEPGSFKRTNGLASGNSG